MISYFMLVLIHSFICTLTYPFSVHLFDLKPDLPFAWKSNTRCRHSTISSTKRVDQEVAEVNNNEGAQIKRWNKVWDFYTELRRYAWMLVGKLTLFILIWRILTATRNREKSHPNCNHTVHAPEICYVTWNNNHFNKYGHCLGDGLHGCMLKIASERERQMNKRRK